jgi:DNA-binding CsgD family transcriptional regulator
MEQSDRSSVSYREWFISGLQKVLPFDGFCFTLVDPQTLLSTGAITEQGVENIHDALFKSEYLQGDVNPYEALIRQKNKVATLGLATGGEPGRSHRYTRVLEPAGFGDELRAVFVSDGACWGYLTLFRRKESPLFQEQDVSFVSNLVPPVARFLRRSSLALPIRLKPEGKSGTGIMVLSDQLQPVSFNPLAEWWMKELRRMEQIDEATLPRPVRAVCMRALAGTAPAPDRDDGSQVCMGLPGPTYLSLRASKLIGPEQSIQLAVWFEEAAPAQVLPLVMDAYALTIREKQIVNQIRQGLSTKEIAAALHISSYTVQDHLKSIFYKTGVTSRRELVGQRFNLYSS